MLNKISLLIVLQLCIMVGLVFGQGITIVVSPEARVEGAFITLGQLAEISGTDTAWVKSLGQLKLGTAPSLGSSIVLTKELLNMRLAATGSNFSGIVWEIPESVTVTTNSQTISGQTLIDKAILGVKKQIGVNVANEDLTILPSSRVQDVITPVGQIELVADLPYGVRYNIPTNVAITVKINGQLFTKVPLTLDVKRYQQVVVTKGQISSMELFSMDNLRYERVDVGRAGAGYFTDMNKVVGLASRRSLKPGMVITDSVVAKPVVIKRGAVVNILARIGNMEVMTAGQAMQDGVEGQLIRVQNTNSNKFLSAKVLDETTVQVLTYKRNG